MDVPQLDFSMYPSQLFWLLLCVIFLFLYVKTVFLPRITGVLEARARRTEGDRLRAQEVNDQAHQMRVSYNAAISAAKQDVHHKVEAAIQAFEHQKEERQILRQKEFMKQRNRLEKQRFLTSIEISANFVDLLLSKAPKGGVA